MFAGFGVAAIFQSESVRSWGPLRDIALMLEQLKLKKTSVLHSIVPVALQAA
jgi:hypothetical protein